MTDANVVLGFINPEGARGRQACRSTGARRARAGEGGRRRSGFPSRRRPGACTGSPTPPWRARCAPYPPNAGWIPAASLSWPSAATGRSTRRRLRGAGDQAHPGPAGARRVQRLGMLFPDVEHHYVRTDKRPLDGLSTWTRCGRVREARVRGRNGPEGEGFTPSRPPFRAIRRPALRRRQFRAHGRLSGRRAPRSCAESFEDAHERQYGYRSPEEGVEIVNVRLIARGASASAVPADAAPRGAPRTSRPVSGACISVPRSAGCQRRSSGASM